MFAVMEAAMSVASFGSFFMAGIFALQAFKYPRESDVARNLMLAAIFFMLAAINFAVWRLRWMAWW